MRKYEEVVAFIEKNKRNPSKYDPEVDPGASLWSMILAPDGGSNALSGQWKSQNVISKPLKMKNNS